MAIFHIFGQGARTVGRRAGMLLGLWIIDLFFVLIVMTPLASLIDKEFGHSLAGESLGRLNLFKLGDFLFKYRESWPLMVGWLAASTGLFLFLSIFLNGGIVGRIAAAEEKAGLAAFFADCGKYFFRFGRLFLFSLPVYILVLGPVFRLISVPMDGWIEKASGDWPVLIASNIKLLLACGLLTIIQMFFGYVKIDLVVRDGKKVIRAMVLMARFLAGRFFQAWTLYLLVGGLLIAAGAVFLAVTNILPQAGISAPWTGFLWAQIFILARIGAKLLFLATEFHFYQRHRLT